MPRNYHLELFADKRCMVCHEIWSARLFCSVCCQVFRLFWIICLACFLNVNKNCVSILCGKFTRPKDVKNPSRILQYIFLPNNVRKSVTLSPKFASVLSADVFDVFDLLFLLLFKMTGFFSWSNLSLILSRDFFGRCLICWAAYW